MKLTNKYNLPEAYVLALSEDNYISAGDISATAIIKAPRQRMLEIRYADKLVADVSDNFMKFFGTAAHYVLERAKVPNALTEELFIINVAGWEVSGRPDLYEKDLKHLSDHKKTSVWSLIFGKNEWEYQINIYAEMLRRAGHPVETASVCAMLQDWRRNEYIRDPKGYPPIPFVEKPIKLWSPEEAKMYLNVRVMLHQSCSILPDDELPLCSEEERWARQQKWAVMKPGVKRAKRVLDSLEEAEQWALDSPIKGLVIDKRPGESIKCGGYCAGSPFCNQWARLQKREEASKNG